MKRMMRLTAAFGVVFAMVLGSPTPAKADPITAAIVTGIGLTGTAAAVATFVINGVFRMAFIWAGGKLLGKSKGSVQERQASVTTLSLGEVPREALIGEAVTGGSLIDAFNHGGRYGTDYVTRCIALTDHVVDALVGYYIDDQYFAFTANGVQAGFSGALDIEFVNASQAGAAPPARFLTASAGSWAATDVLASITHVWFSYKCDEAVWPQGHPQVRFLLRGLKVYDPRKDAALGYSGAGAQTWADPSTHTFSRNAALLRYAFARGIYATGRQGQPEHLLIGRGLSAEEAPPESVIAAANLCDETVGGAARYTANGVIRASDDFIVVEEMFAAAMAGVIVQREGGVEIEPGQAKAAVVTITDADLVAGEPVTFSEFLPDGDGGRVNTVIPRYVEPAQNWKDHSGPVRRNQTDIATDRGPREITLPLMLVTAGAQADRCAEITRRLGRLERRTTIVLPPEYGRLEEGDWIAWTSARRFAGGTVRWRIESWTLDEKWRMRLSLREIASSVFTDPTALTDGSDPPTDPGDLAALDLQGVTAQVVLLSGSGSAVPAVRFTWSAVDPGVIAIRAEVRRDGETVAAPTRTDEVSAGTMTVTNGVGPDQAIQVRLVPITRLSRPVTPSAWVSLTTGSLTAGDVVPITPGNVAGTPTISITSTIASDGTQTSRLFGTWTAPSNALSYVVELDNGTILQQFPVTENAVEDRIVATGPTYRYRVKALSRTGTLSADWSSWSAYATAAGKTTKPPAITSGSATAIGGRRVRVVQKRPAMADYLHTLIYRNTTGFNPDDVPQGVYTVATDEEFVDVNVTVGTNYRYYARTVDRSGNEADTATFLGNAIPVFTSVAGGDVNPTDPVLVNTQISVNGLGALSGIGTGNNTIVANSQAAFAPRRAFNFDTDAEGFNGIGVTINWYAHGIIHVVSTSSDPIFYTPTFSYRGSTIRKIRARIRYTSATTTWEGSCFWRSTTLGWSADRRVDVVAPPPFVQNQWSIVEWDMTGPGGGDPYTEGTILELRFDLSSSFGDWEIDWIALGSEAVDPVGVRGITDLANRTQDNTALYIQGQADWATYTGRTTTHLANAIDTNSYLTSGLNTHFRPDQMMNGAVGTQLARDSEFHQAWPPADTGIYNNSGGTKVTITRVADATAPNASGFKLTIAYDGTGTPNSNPTPGFGGIYQGLQYGGDGNPSRPGIYAKNTKILYKIWANIPVGRTLETAANSHGNEGYATWLTSQAGTGNWALYELIYYIGTTGAFSSIGHMYVAGGPNVAFSWHIAKYEQVDITSGVSAFTGNLRRVNNGAALSDTLLVTGDGTAAFVNGQSPWVTDTSITPTTVTNRTQRLTSAGQIDFAYIEGATRPANNATVGAEWGSNLTGRPPVTQGDSLTEDPAMADPSSWTGAVGTFATITDGRVARTVFRGTTGTMAGARHVPVDATKTYMIEGWYRSVGGTTVVYAGVDLQDGSGNTISEDGTYYLYMPAGYTIGTGWEYYSRVFGAGTARPIPANARQMRCLFFPNYGGGANSTEVQGLRIVEVTTVGGSLRRADGTVATEAALVTSLGTANLVVNQGPGATALANRVLNDRYEGGVKLIQQPDGGQFNVSVSNQVGQLEIVLPFAWNVASPMITFDVVVHDYSTGRTSTYTVAGHHYNTGSNGWWANVTATFNGPRAFSRPVKFGFNAAGKATVWIGSVGDLWQYPNITIRGVQIGYASQGLAWESGWAVSLNNTAISGTYVNMTTPYVVHAVAVPRSGDQVFGEGIYEAPPGSGLPGDNVIATRAAHRTDQGTALNIVSQAPTATSSDFAVVTGATRPSDRATSDLSMIAADAHVTIQGNRIGKASGGYTWTTGSAYSRQWYVGGASASARRLQSGGLAETMFGLSDSYTLGDAGYVHIDYAFYLFSSSSLPHIQLYEGGAPQGAAILVAMGDLFTVTYDGVNVRYYRESAGVSTLLRTVSTTAARAFRVHVATTGADNVSSGVEDLRFTPFNRAARVDELWSTDGSTQYAENLIRTAAGTALNVINQGPLATSTLTEAKVQGRYLGEYAGNAAATTAGLQNGDTYVDNSLTPFGFKVQSGGVIKEVDTSGLFRGFSTQADINSTTMTDKVTLNLTNIQANSYMVVWMAMDIELTPGRTRKSGGTPGINPQGTWEIVEDATGGSSSKILLSGTWEANRIGSGGGADNIESFVVDGVGEPNSDISRRWRVRAGGSRTWKLRMKTNSAENLLAVGLNVLVQIQRNPA